MRKILWLFIVVICAAPQLGAGVIVDLSLEPSKTIPGIPVTFRVSVTNDTPGEIALPDKAVLHVTREDGSAFDAVMSRRGVDTIAPVGDGTSSKTLAPFSSADLSYWASLERAYWFCDRRLQKPGSYRVTLELRRNGDAGTPSLVSNPATLVIEVPTGRDADLWAILSKDDPGCFWPSYLKQALWDEYYPSRYTQYALPSMSTMDTDAVLAYCEKAIAIDPSASIADVHRVSAAGFQLEKMGAGIIDRDLDAALTAQRTAESLLKKVEREAKDPMLRKEASEIMNGGQLLSQDLVREAISRSDPSKRGLVEAGGVCAEQLSGGSNRVYVGFFNGVQSVTVDKGKDNRFTPAPFDRGQPTVFKGTGWFSIDTNDLHLTWHLQGQQIQIDVKSLGSCPAGFPPPKDASAR